jgi:DNA-binding NtrC family response regulator
MLKVLVVEDEPDLCALIADALADDGHEVTCAKDGAEALAATAAAAYDVVLTDVRLPKLDGLTLFRRLREQSPTTDTIVMTGDANIAEAVAILKEGAFDYLTKPIRLEELGLQMARIASYRALRRDVDSVRAELADASPPRDQLLGQLVGHSPEMQQLIKKIETVAHSDASVVIRGESGTGKELVARALHSSGARRGKAFVAVNCAAFPDTLIESELFGHERGAFTGATNRREGRFKAADGGTLFLDEVAELSQAAQAKLLRVLQEGTIEPLGSNDSVRVDVRIISATHRDLRKQIAAGLFREDLYYRINTIEMAIPALRDRTGDLAVLVNLFIKRYSNDKAPTTGITWRAWNAVAAYPFPGNVRELMHTVQHAVLLSRGGQIDLQHLPTSIAGRQTFEGRADSATMAPLSQAMKQFERAYLARVLETFDGKRGAIAELLGISRKNLWEKLKMHGLSDRSGLAEGTTTIGA